MGMSQQVFRTTYYATGSVCGLVPTKIGRRLRWSRVDLAKASMHRQADCALMLRTLEGVSEWLHEQKIRTDDARIALLHQVMQELEGKY